MDKSKRIIFAGSDAIGLPLLEVLREKGARWELAGIVSQPDRPAGRGHKLQPNPITAWAREKTMPVFQPETAKEGLAAWLRETHCDVLLVLAYGQILPAEVLNAPAIGSYNFHGSLLPHLRGASPIETALATGDKTTGMAFMKMVAALDAGAVAAVEEIEIGADATGPSLRGEMASATARLWKRVEGALFAGELEFTEQNAAKASFCRKLTRLDGRADFSLSAERIAARFRAFFPWPGLWFPHGEGIIKVGGCAAGHSATHSADKPGTVLAADKTGVEVQCGSGSLRLTHLQKPGGRMLPADDFLRGYPLQRGDFLASSPALPLILSKPFPRRFFEDPDGFQFQ